jgi:hypothetical protein
VVIFNCALSKMADEQNLVALVIDVMHQVDGAVAVSGLGGQLFAQDPALATYIRSTWGGFVKFLESRPEFLVEPGPNGSTSKQVQLQPARSMRDLQAEATMMVANILKAKGGRSLLCSLLSDKPVESARVREAYGSFKKCLLSTPSLFSLLGNGNVTTVTLLVLQPSLACTVVKRVLQLTKDWRNIQERSMHRLSPNRREAFSVPFVTRLLLQKRQ